MSQPPPIYALSRISSTIDHEWGPSMRCGPVIIKSQTVNYYQLNIST